jgi:hypothetical protein
LPQRRERLSELDEEKEHIVAGLRATEDTTSTARPADTGREYLALATWYENPDAVQPGEWLSLAAALEKGHRAYMRFGACFGVEAEGVFSLTLEEVGTSLREERTFWSAATP